MAKLLIALLAFLLLPMGPARAGVPEGATCLVPAKPGGGFDITCQLLRSMLHESGETRVPLSITYMPGGVGALAFNQAVRQRPADKRVVTAFSSGTLLNLAQGRFGSYGGDDVRWLAVFGVDYGVVAVRRDAPYRDLRALLDDIKAAPHRIAFGSSGTFGSQDWIKSAMLVQAAGISRKAMRVVAFEGGGDALAALAGGHIQVLAGDAAEVFARMHSHGDLRVLAVLSAQRLPRPWASIPTAHEQGYDLQWSALRGVYLGPAVDDGARAEWLEAIRRATRHERFRAMLAETGLQESTVMGADLEQLVQRQLRDYRSLIKSLELEQKTR